MEEANGLVRWPEEAPALGHRDEDVQGLPLEEMPRKNSGVEAEPGAGAQADAAAARDAPDVRALQREGGDRPAILPRFGE